MFKAVLADGSARSLRATCNTPGADHQLTGTTENRLIGVTLLAVAYHSPLPIAIQQLQLGTDR